MSSSFSPPLPLLHVPDGSLPSALLPLLLQSNPLLLHHPVPSEVTQPVLGSSAVPGPRVEEWLEEGAGQRGETRELWRCGREIVLSKFCSVCAVALRLRPHIEFVSRSFCPVKPFLIFQVRVAVAGCFSPGMAAGEHGVGEDPQRPAVRAGLHRHPNSGLLFHFLILLSAIIPVADASPAVVIPSSDLGLGGAVRRAVPHLWDPGAPGLHLVWNTNESITPPANVLTLLFCNNVTGLPPSLSSWLLSSKFISLRTGNLFSCFSSLEDGLCLLSSHQHKILIFYVSANHTYVQIYTFHTRHVNISSARCRDIPATKMSFWVKHWDNYLLFQWQQVRMFLMRCWDISIRVCGDKKQVFEAKRIRGFSETIFWQWSDALCGILTMPKSPSLTQRQAESHRKTFSGLMSLWTKPRECRCDRAPHSWDTTRWQQSSSIPTWRMMGGEVCGLYCDHRSVWMKGSLQTEKPLTSRPW